MGTNNGNHGKKGRSGRKSTMDEFAKNQAIMKAWNKINKELEDNPAKDIALPLALKDMVAKVGNPDGSNIKPIQIYAGKSIQGHEGNSKNIQSNQENKSD